MTERSSLNGSFNNPLGPHSNQQDISEEFSKLIKEGYAALMPAIRASNSLPKGEQWDLFCTSPLFKPKMDFLGNNALELMALIFQHQGLYRDVRKRDLEEKNELIVEANDKILERVGIHLDELSGIRRNPVQGIPEIVVSSVNAASGSWNRDVAHSAVWKEVQFSKSSQAPVVLRNARVTQRPQVKFQDKIDNSNTPFEPRIKEKPNALKPLAILFESLPGEDTCYSHPYEFELDRFQEKIDTLNLSPKSPELPRPIEETPLIMITQEDQLLDMLNDLRVQTEIAVDLEHHSYRSFQGFTCLMQISTREKDYIIDTLELRHKLYILNEVFTHPKIVKVFHGADCDVQWLQRDLNLYVVNMFDTYQAALLLSLPRLSLAFLLKSICNIDANKTFQLYDWRNRPLGKEALKYAREDTHYLLYIYDVLSNRLIEKSNGGSHMLQSVIYRSADTCKKRYWKFIYKEDSYESMYRQSKKNFDNRQMYAMKELYAWRDKTARDEDESTGYILPNHMLMLISEKLPKEMQGILACCNPIPPLVRQNLVLLHQIILKAREQPLVSRSAAVLNIETRSRPLPQTNVNLEGALHCPHDLTHSVDFRDDLPTLLNNRSIDINCSTDFMETQSLLPVFGKDEKSVDELLQNNCHQQKMNLSNQIHFMSPFERYKKMLIYTEDEEKKSKEEKEKEIFRDTQKLLDECMRERLKATATGGRVEESLNIKEEIQDYGTQSRKRQHSQDSSICESLNDDTPNTSVKSESGLDESISHKSKKKNNKHSYKGPEPQGASFVNEHHLELKQEKYFDSNNGSPKKKRKRRSDSNNVNELVIFDDELNQQNERSKQPFEDIKISLDTSSPNFVQYDYSQVDYNQYQQPQFSSTPKRSQEKFKYKGKKRQQNQSFTFARQYGSGTNKKKS